MPIQYPNPVLSYTRTDSTTSSRGTQGLYYADPWDPARHTTGYTQQNRSTGIYCDVHARWCSQRLLAYVFMWPPYPWSIGNLHHHVWRVMHAAQSHDQMKTYACIAQADMCPFCERTQLYFHHAWPWEKKKNSIYKYHSCSLWLDFCYFLFQKHLSTGGREWTVGQMIFSRKVDLLHCW